MLTKEKQTRQEQRRVHKLTGEELYFELMKERDRSVRFTVDIFKEVLNKEFGFGEVRLGRVAEGVYNLLGIPLEGDDG